MRRLSRQLTAAVLATTMIASTGFAEPEQDPSPGQETTAERASGAQPVLAVDEIGEMGSLVAPRIAQEAASMLAEADHDPSTATIRVSWLDAANFHYAVRVGLRGNPADDDAPILATCRGCTTDELVDAATRAVQKALDRDRRAADAAAAEQDRESELTPVVEPAEPLPEQDASPRRGLGPMGWAGVGALGVGVAGVATGGAFLGIGETRPDVDKSKLRDFRPSGYALIAVGGAMVITGVVLLVVDRSRARKEALLQGRNARVDVGPLAGRNEAGFVVSGRF